ncbi:MAG TPA: hypothetical protein PK280_05660 [Planctomycetota bacterium]|nr:hypothetical protein [Planctomycetota bacterium]
MAERTFLGTVWRWLAFLVLLPVVAAEVWALAQALGTEGRQAIEAGSPTAEALWLLGGATAYGLIHALLHKPITTYVFAHELTHALWALATGHKVGKIRVGSDSGHVETAGSNFLVRLAPYFFPLYSLLLLGAWAATEAFVPEFVGYRGWLFAGLGFTYAFHVLLTIHSLWGGQSDLKAEGYCFSLALIAAVNLQIIAALFAAASKTVGWAAYEQAVGRTLAEWAKWAAGLF